MFIKEIAVYNTFNMLKNIIRNSSWTLNCWIFPCIGLQIKLQPKLKTCNWHSFFVLGRLAYQLTGSLQSIDFAAFGYEQPRLTSCKVGGKYFSRSSVIRTMPPLPPLEPPLSSSCLLELYAPPPSSSLVSISLSFWI